MPIKHAIWTVGDKPTPLPITRLATEQLLEDMIEIDPRILSEQWLLIGRQEHTPTGGRIDLLAIAPDASLVLIELKRDKTPTRHRSASAGLCDLGSRPDRRPHRTDLP